MKSQAGSMCNDRAREITMQPLRPGMRCNKYEMVEPGKDVVTRNDDFEDVSVELEVCVVGRYLQFVCH